MKDQAVIGYLMRTDAMYKPVTCLFSKGEAIWAYIGAPEQKKVWRTVALDLHLQPGSGCAMMQK